LVPLDVVLAVGAPVALVLALPTSLPACGSVRHIVPAHLPLSMVHVRRLICSGCRSAMTSAAPWVSAGYMLNAVLAPHMISSAIACSVNGPAWPPNSSGIDRRAPAAS
jgi:hypothetical protein